MYSIWVYIYIYLYIVEAVTTNEWIDSVDEIYVMETIKKSKTL